jgi:hypothetical protein
MSKQAAEHHLKAAEHYEQAALHHREAAKRHEEDRYQEASDDNRSANEHINAALFHAAVAEAFEARQDQPGPRLVSTRPRYLTKIGYKGGTHLRPNCEKAPKIPNVYAGCEGVCAVSSITEEVAVARFQRKPHFLTQNS